MKTQLEIGQVYVKKIPDCQLPIWNDITHGSSLMYWLNSNDIVLILAKNISVNELISYKVLHKDIIGWIESPMHDEFIIIS